MKNTFCLVRGNQAVLSQHFGDLSDEGVERQWRTALSVMQQIYAFQRVVCDAHPGYRARQWQALPLKRYCIIAHAAACLAENGWPLDGGDVIALTLDGIGMGENGALWGGECLRVNYRDCEHLGGLPAVALPGRSGGAQPWRNLLAHCLAFVPDWQQRPETHAVQAQNWPLLATAIRGINAPRASSGGRGCLRAGHCRCRAMKVKQPAGWKRWLQCAVSTSGHAASDNEPGAPSGNSGWTGRRSPANARGRFTMRWQRAGGTRRVPCPAPSLSTICSAAGCYITACCVRACVIIFLTLLFFPVTCPQVTGRSPSGRRGRRARSCSQRT
jgi:hypothetical protein